VRNGDEACNVFWERGWTDGLPIIAPTEDKVTAFLDNANLEPDQVIGEAPERNRVFTAEKVAINAVMAGCLPEYMPVIVAVVQAMTAPEYMFNHLASLGSPWPMIYVSGPVVKQLKINAGSYLFGTEDRANATIGRAISLLLRNCAEAKRGGLQAGQWGNVMRGGGCVVGENEEVVPWTSLRVQLGFPKDKSAVFVMSTMYPPSMVWCSNLHPERILDAVSEGLSSLGFRRSIYVLLVPPNIAEIFHHNGWSKDNIRDHLMATCKRSIACLKRMTRWGQDAPGFSGFAGDPNVQKVEPGDEEKYVYLFRQNPEYDHILYGPSARDINTGIYVVVCGGQGMYLYAHGMYGASTQPVSRLICMK